MEPREMQNRSLKKLNNLE